MAKNLEEQTTEELYKQISELEKKKQELESVITKKQNASFYEVIEFAKSKNIDKNRLLAFIQNLLEEEKILVVYDYEEDGKQKQSILKTDSRGQNTFIKHCKEGKLTQEQALIFAKNQAGIDKVKEIFASKTENK